MGGPIPDAVPQGDSGAQPAAGQGFPSDQVYGLQQAGGYGVAYGSPMGSFSSGGFASDGSAVFSGTAADAGAVRPGEGTQGSDRVAGAGIGPANSPDEANVILSQDAEGNVTRTWNKPLDPADGYLCKIFADNSVKESPEKISEQLAFIKSDVANGEHVKDGNKVDFTVPDTLPEYLTTNSDANSQAKDKAQGDPADQPPACNSKGGKMAAKPSHQPMMIKQTKRKEKKLKLKDLTKKKKKQQQLKPDKETKPPVQKHSEVRQKTY